MPRVSGSIAALMALAASWAVAVPTTRGDYAAAPAAFEHGSSDRTSLFPVDAHLGPGERVVRNADPRGVWNVAEAADGALFSLSGVLGGEGAEPTVTRLDPETLSTVWRTGLPAPDGQAIWNYPGTVAVHANGFVYAVYGTRLAKLDSRSGTVLAVRDLPAPNGVADTTYNGFVVLPDGMILAKSHHRKANCKAQGYRAFIECGVDGLPPSALVLIEPDTLKVTWTGTAPELIGGRITAVRFEGQTLIYLAGDTFIHRMRYEKGRLVADLGWGPVRYRSAQQTPGTAVVGFGPYVVIQNDAIPTQAPLTLTVVAQRDAHQQFTIAPFAPSPTGHWYYMPSKVSTDWANRRFYTSAAYDGLTALDFEPGQGLRVAWRVAQPSGAFMTLLGPDDARIIVATDMSGAAPGSRGAPVHDQEDLVWRRTGDGRELGRIKRLPRNFGLTLTPDRAGEIVYPTRDQGVFLVRPAEPTP